MNKLNQYNPALTERQSNKGKIIMKNLLTKAKYTLIAMGYTATALFVSIVILSYVLDDLILAFNSARPLIGPLGNKIVMSRLH